MKLPQEIIRKKREGESLSSEELKDFFSGYLEGTVADYQLSAMLMAIILKGMDHREASELTLLMRDSGKVFNWDYPTQTVVDKHSTGGIGDKTSLVLTPLCALSGLKIPMISGRGLGHTGGTLDKLDAIGVNPFIPASQVEKQMKELGAVFMGQTEEIVPMDKKLYAMRDVTATVESVPLITASILSKKLAEGLGGLVMDVKWGSGAFMRRLEDAREMAASLSRVGKQCGLKMRCLITDMNSPLGSYAGNGLEIYECIELMQGKGPASTRDLVLELSSEMIRLAFPERSDVEIKKDLINKLNDGSALELFSKMVAAQGGDTKFIDNKERLLQASIKEPVVVGSGTVKSIDVRTLGLAVLELGGGRKLVTDKIDPWVGLSDTAHVGDEVSTDRPVAIIHGNDKDSVDRAKNLLIEAYKVGDDVDKPQLIVEKI